MPRNLLPRLRQAPNPANVPLAKVAEWTPISTPGDLGKLDFGVAQDDDVRTRIQSIPSPWARMLLFRAALDDPGHPARRLVESELLDAFQFLWSASERPNAVPTFRTVRVADIAAQAEHAGTQRAEWLGRALRELLPRRDGAGPAPAFDAITLVLVGGRPVAATSPYTVLFTAEDAAQLPRAQTGPFFRFATGDPYQDLAARPFAFQRYVAQVLLPQLDAGQALDDPSTDAATVQRLLKRWLQDQVGRCRRLAASADAQAQLEAPSSGDWRAAAETLGLIEHTQLAGGVRLYRQREGAQMRASPWVLRPGRAGAAQPPLVLDPASFDGRYYPGAPAHTLTGSLAGLDRTTLPGTATFYPWVSPADDWFTDQILVLADALDPASVRGFGSFRSLYPGDRKALQVPHTTLPLKREVFRWFGPEELEHRLTVEVQPGGQIEVALRIPVGAEGREMTVRRRYDESAVFHKVPGPALTLWPRFESAAWRDYMIFRRDQSPSVAQYVTMHATAAGELLDGETEQRNDVVRVTAVDRAPDAIEFASTITGGGAPQRLGVVLPRYAAAGPPVPQRWHVGVDFGTSNTVISVRTDGMTAAAVLGVESMTLPLTAANAEARPLLDAYFFPHALRPEPFGTAVVRHRQLPTLDLFRQRFGVRVNVPFSGHVERDEHNVVVGDLKWSTDAERRFLSASYLRHLMAVVLAEAVRRGVDPRNVEVAWAYPRSFTRTQANQLAALWAQVRQYFHDRLGAVGEVRQGLDESRAVLRHFFNASVVTGAGDVNVIVDVGGGTSDIAMYGRGRTLALDSVMLGGRNLTGKRLQAGTAEQLRNPFVQRFVAWSRQHGLDGYPLEARAVEKYLADGQDHLAFSFLLRTEWFARHGQAFSGDEACHAFQGMVLYFFGSLFYYLGLSLRSLADADAGAGAAPEDAQAAARALVPVVVTLAGNGSRYVRWLTDLTDHAAGSFDAFGRAFGRLLVGGMGLPADVRGPTVQLTGEPKLEVALGLVAGVTPGGLDESRAQVLPVMGERVTASVGEARQTRAFGAMARVGPEDLVFSDAVASVVWDDGELEIERFHRAFLEALQSLVGIGAHWTATAQRTRALFTALDRRELQQAARARLDYVASDTGGFGGSLFMLETTTVLDRMLQGSFVDARYGTPTVGIPTITAR